MVEIVGGGGGEVNLISCQSPKLRRSYLKKWVRPIKWIQARASDESLVTH